MELLGLDDVRKKLELKYKNDVVNFPNVFNAFIPKLANESQRRAVVNKVRDAFGISLPISFIEVLERWDFSNFEIAGFEFCRTGDYSEFLVQINDEKLAPGWWDDVNQEKRPVDLLMIAQSDPYIAILDTKSGEIFTYVDADGASSSKLTAANFAFLLRGLGSIEAQTKNLSDNVDSWARYISEEVGSKNYLFWRYTVEQAIERS